MGIVKCFSIPVLTHDFIHSILTRKSVSVFSVALSFYPIPTGRKLAGNKYDLVGMRETEK